MKAAIVVRSAALVALSGAAIAAIAACAPTPPPAPATPGLSREFNVADFAWSAEAGAAAIVGDVDFSAEGRTYACAGSVGLTPETPYTRHRFMNLYGSLDGAAVPAATVRARTVGEASADYRAYVRDTTCDAEGRFRFEGLPAGGWFVIAPVRAGSEEPVVLMRRVRTPASGAVAVTLD